ncbi:hypothetical protein G9C85_01215 [Halorubellus sp. JP-L1]|uniref:hypothetical protein n=1 Tax=Halorubellus sp. JP-L1 TaxID=2715753 RepID=UPI0014085D1C|nr:hypothetical protein [Halorubellus sp. JP-L1]NHN40255.1 hypothetical protein [Halorubellus sp. JP-L1]
MDVRSYLASTRFAVVVAGIAIAIPTGYVVSDVLANWNLGFVAMFVLGVSVPRAYSRSWPEYDDHLRAVAWTVGACAAALAVLLVAFVATSAFFGGLGAAVGAFLVVELVVAAASLSIERAERADAEADPAGDRDAGGERSD